MRCKKVISINPNNAYVRNNHHGANGGIHHGEWDPSGN